MASDFDAEKFKRDAQQLVRDVMAGKVDLTPHHRSSMLKLLESACAHSQWTNRMVGWMFFGIGALYGLPFLLAGNVLGFSTGVAVAIPGYFYVRRMKDGTRHAAYRLVLERPEAVRALERVSQTNGVELFDFVTETRTVRLATNRATAPQLHVLCKAALPQLATAQAS